MIWVIVKKHLPYLGLVLVLYVLLALGAAYANNWYEPPFSPSSDLNVHIPIAFKLHDPRLYSTDPVFGSSGWKLHTRLDSLLFPLLLGWLFPILGGIRPVLIVLAFILGLVFVVGIYGLTYYLSGDFLAGVIAAFLASLDYPALGGVQLGFAPASVLPRNFVVAVSPIIVVLFLRWRDGKSLWVLYASLGLMTIFHVLAPLHLVLILTLALIAISTLSWSSLKTVLVGGIICLICALPSVVTFLPTLNDVVTVTSDEASVVVTRYAFAVRPSWVEILLFGIAFLPFALFGGLGFRRALKRQANRKSVFRVYSILCLIGLLLPWLGQVINAFTLSFTRLEMLRITRYYIVLSFAPVGMLLASWIKRRGRLQFVLVPVVLVVIMALSRPQVGTAVFLKGLEWFGPGQEVPAETEGRDAQLGMVWNWHAFTDLCHWVDLNTPVEALFLAPTDWNPFRVYARRGLVVSWKGTEWPGWAERYAMVQSLYDCPDAGAFVETATAYAVDYVVVMRELALPGLELAYENDYYAVYKAR